MSYEKMVCDLSVEQILAAMMKHQEAHQSLFNQLIIRAKVQEYTEGQFDKLAVVAKATIELVCLVQVGDCIDGAWIDKRDRLVEQALHLIEDAPSAPEREVAI